MERLVGENKSWRGRWVKKKSCNIRLGLRQIQAERKDKELERVGEAGEG